MWLTEMIIYKDNKVLGNKTFSTHIVIKIISQDICAILSKKQIFNKIANYRNIAWLLFVPHIELNL